jgi:glycine/serine hydroxymethyltransferase
MREVAALIARVLENISDESALADVRRKVGALTNRFPLYAWKLAAAATR